MKWKILILVMFYFVTQDQEITTSNPTKICLDHTNLPNKPLQKQVSWFDLNACGSTNSLIFALCTRQF